MLKQETDIFSSFKKFCWNGSATYLSPCMSVGQRWTPWQSSWPWGPTPVSPVTGHADFCASVWTVNEHLPEPHIGPGLTGNDPTTCSSLATIMRDLTNPKQYLQQQQRQKKIHYPKA